MLKTSWLTNPFYVYIISYSVVFIVYALGWSNAFSDISLSVQIFFGITFLVSLLFSYPISLRNKNIEFNISTNTLNKTVLFGMTLGYIVEFFYNRGVPIFLILKGSDYDYTSFGIPTFHVFLITFTSFYSVYLFHQYLCDKTKKTLLYTLYSCVPHILIFNRGSLLFVLTSMLFVFLLSIKQLKWKRLLSILLLILIILFYFGKFGNLRSAGGDNTYIPKASGVNPQFLSSKIPNEYFWGYAYIASPMANFQHNTNIKKAQTSFSDYACFVKSELLFDFISKRLPGECEIKKEQVFKHFTVGTQFTNSYCLIGWTGPIILFLFGSFVTLFYLLLIPIHSKYYVTALAILLTVFVYNTFSNMWSFTGLSFQLVYPIIGSLLNKKNENHCIKK